MKKEKFEFVNPTSEDDFLIEEEAIEQNDKTPTPDDEEKQKKAKRKAIIKRYTISFSITFVLSALIFVFGLIWQDEYTSLMAIGDALWLVFAVWLTIAWVLMVYNYNLFSPLLHGTKTFILMFMGKRPKEDYYTYMKKIQDNPIPKYIILVAWITTLIIFLLALTTLVALKA